ncbi:uncharacterized protein V2V93DRAFT_371485 [Kockiozyma suomiensis]|uniref:uncharacterized protein n=1 Tax=Kockiozyma suomiensis TaxID=1337062 RepID=UPI0033436F39
MRLLLRSQFCLLQVRSQSSYPRAFATSSRIFSKVNPSNDFQTRDGSQRLKKPTTSHKSISPYISHERTGFTVYPSDTRQPSPSGTDGEPYNILDIARNIPDEKLFTHNIHLKHLPTSKVISGLTAVEVRPTTVLSKRKPVRRIESQFADVMVLKLASGAGGNGNVTFLRDAGRSKGPPDGGDGGDGGSIYVQAVEGDSSLHKLQKRFLAESGESGRPSQMDGANGKDIIIRVPVGTHITLAPDTTLERDNPPPGQGWIHSSGFQEFNEERKFFQDLVKRKVLDDRAQERHEQIQDAFPADGIDLIKPGPPILLLKGGRGGLGNRHFHTADIRNPRFATCGRAGLKGIFRFELKLLADLGLVGLPNAGKSTLLRAISNARPRIGHWEFTTLSPSVGTILLDIASTDESFTVADIPGIIAGANLNRGMGIDFLRHIERTKGLVFVIGLDSPNPADNLRILINELGPERMDGKKKLIVATKADLPRTQEKYLHLLNSADILGWKTIPVSATRKSTDIEILIREMASLAGVLSPGQI